MRPRTSIIPHTPHPWVVPCRSIPRLTPSKRVDLHCLLLLTNTSSRVLAATQWLNPENPAFITQSSVFVWVKWGTLPACQMAREGPGPPPGCTAHCSLHEHTLITKSQVSLSCHPLLANTVFSIYPLQQGTFYCQSELKRFHLIYHQAAKSCWQRLMDVCKAAAQQWGFGAFAQCFLSFFHPNLKNLF